MKYWKRIFIGILSAAVLAAGSPIGVQAVTSGNIDKSENTDTSVLPDVNVQEPIRITGFDTLFESNIMIRNKIELERLTGRMPETLTAFTEESEPIEIPVVWECVGDYTNSNYYYYQFNPVWDEERILVSGEIDVPYIAVFIGMEEGLKLSSTDENREIIYDFMRMEMGFNVAATCGVLANIQAESSFRPTANMIDTNGLISYGLCQWNGSRFIDLQNYCSKNNLDYQSVEGQLYFLKYELEHSEASACSKVKNVEDTAEGAYEAGYNWARYFERCSSVYFETRANLAKDKYWPIYGGEENRTKYTITYYLDGGKNHADNPKAYYSTSGDIVFKDPTRKGYIFQGWYTNSNMTKQIKSISGATGKDLELYAKWEAIHYNIQFSGNGAESGQMKDITDCEYDVIYSLSPNKYKRNGCKFVGWNTSKDGSGTSYANKEYVQNLTAQNGTTVVLYAQWKKQEYEIQYKLNGGKNHKKNPASFTVDTKTITLKAPTKTGYTFEGWYSDKKYKKQVTSIPKGSNKNITLYAKWKVHTYKVVYNGNKATSGKMTKVINCQYGKSYKLTANKFKKKNYIFAGWNTKKDGSGTAVGNKAKFKNLTEKDNATVTLYAQWKKVGYTITYVLNGGIQVDNPTEYYANTKTFRLNDPVREGYTFEGWYTESSFENRITKIAKGTKKNLTLYAKWSVNHYTVRFDGNGADTGEMQPLECQYDVQYTILPNNYQKDGYQFIGWNTKADGSGTFYRDEAGIENLSSIDGAVIILYAQWEIPPK